MNGSFIKDQKLHLHEVFQKWESHRAIRGPKILMTYQQWKTQIGQLTRYLQSIGLKEGDRLGIYLENNVEYVSLILAAWVLKSSVVLIPIRYSSGQVQEIVCDMGLKYLVVGRTFVPSDSGPPFKKDLKILTGLLKSSAKIMSYYSRFESWILDLDQEATVLFSSGSTGKPKKIVHSLRNFLESSKGSISFYQMTEKDSYVLSLPLNHIGGLMIIWRMLLVGGTLVIPSALKNLESSIRCYSPDYVSLVGTQLIRFLSKEYMHKYLRKMKAVIVGGGPIPEWPLSYCKTRGIPLTLTYGLTEATSQVTSSRPDDILKSHRDCGYPLPHIQIKIDEKNEIFIKGGSLLTGHLNSKGKIISLLDEEKWFATRDLGKIDEKGRLQVLGRTDLMFISGGENIFPNQIEESIKKIPWVVDSIVVPVPHKEFGKVPLAFIETLRRIPLKKVITHLKSRLPSYMVPKKIVFIDENFSHNGMKFGRKNLQEYAHRIISDQKIRA